MRIMCLLLGALLPSLAFAGDDAALPDDAPPTIYQKVTIIDGDAIDVKATVEGPSIVRFQERKRLTFHNMVQLRADFNAEMHASIDEVR